MADETVDFSMKKGATGTVLVFTLKDENGPVPMAGWQFVKITLQQSTLQPAVNQATCTMDPDQSANPGQGTFAFGSNANIAAGEYNLEWYARDAAGKDYYWPTDSEEPYGKVLVEDHLG